MERDREVPAPIRVLSESTLTIYLYHLFFIPLALPYTQEWGRFRRIAFLAAAGVFGASAIVLIGRKMLAKHSRLLLGS